MALTKRHMPFFIAESFEGKWGLLSINGAKKQAFCVNGNSQLPQSEVGFPNPLGVFPQLLKLFLSH